MELNTLNVTIKDVAKAAGVSVATVSRVLNKSAVVSNAASEKVNDAIKNLNYSPNFLGRNLRKCETNIILAIIPSTEHSYYSEIIHGMQDTASILGYDILLNTSNSRADTELRILSMLFNRTVDAAVLLGTHLNAEKLNELNEKYNIALCSERVEGAKVLTVNIDDQSGAYCAVSELIKKGHTKIGMISSKFRALSSIDREIGYENALKDNGIIPRKDYYYLNTYDYEDGCKAFEYFMNLNDPPTAIMAISDLLAIGAVKKATEMGYNVGRDMAIIGFDNISFSEMYIPSISTVAQPCYNMGRTVIENLIDNLNGSQKCNERIIMPHQLILRRSTGD